MSTPVDPAVYPFALRARRVVSAAASAPAVAAFPSATVAALDTVLLLEADAQAQATRRQALAEAYAEEWSGQLVGTGLALTPGTVVILPAAFVGATAQGLVMQVRRAVDLKAADDGIATVTMLVKRT